MSATAHLQPASRAHCPSSVPSPSPAPEPTSSGREYQATYPGADGRRKATLHAAFAVQHQQQQGPSGVGGGGGAPAAPWGIGYQLSEKSLVWSRGLHERLLKQAAGGLARLSEQEVEARLEALAALLPGLRLRLATEGGIKAGALAQLLSQEPEVLAARLVELRALFPAADVGEMAARAPELVGLGWAGGGRRLGASERLTPGLPGDRYLATKNHLTAPASANAAC